MCFTSLASFCTKCLLSNRELSGWGEVVVPFTGIDTSAQSFFSFIPAWYTVNSNKAKRGAASGGTQFRRIAGINWFRH